MNARSMIPVLVTLAGTITASAQLPTPEIELDLNDYYQGSTDWQVPPNWPVLGQVNEMYVVESGYETIEWEGDRLGYAANGVGDVDGDGYDDLAINFYFRAVDLDDDGVIEPSERRVGCVEVLSGNGGSRIGEMIVGNPLNPNEGDLWLAHAINHIDLLLPHEFDPVTGKRTKHTTEVVLTTSRATEPGINNPNSKLGGAVFVYAFTDDYNTDPMDTDPHWVNVLTIWSDDTRDEFGFTLAHSHGTTNDDSPLSYHIEDLYVGSRVFSGDGVDDKGGFWIFCMPDVDVWEDHRDNAGALNPGDPFVQPVQIYASDASFSIVDGDPEDPDGPGGDPPIDPLRFGAKILPFSDLDGDGLVDVMAGSDTSWSDGHGLGYGKMYGFLTTSDVRTGTDIKDVDPCIEYDSTAMKAVGADWTSATQLFLEWQEADFIIQGDADNQLKRVVAGEFTGDDKLDFAVSTQNDTIPSPDEYRIDIFEVAKETGVGGMPSGPTAQSVYTLGGAATAWFPNEYASISETSGGNAVNIEAKDNVGDTNADGVDDLMIWANVVRPAFQILDLTNLDAMGDGYDVIYSYKSEEKWTDADKIGENGDWRPPHGVLTAKITSSVTYEASPFTIRAWPAWDANGDGLNDVLVSAVTYPWPIPPIIDTENPMKWHRSLDGYHDTLTNGLVGSGGTRELSEHMCKVDSDETDGNYGDGISGCTTTNQITQWTTYSGGINTYYVRTPTHDPFADVGKMYMICTPAFAQASEECASDLALACTGSTLPSYDLLKITLTGGGLKPDGTDFVIADVVIEELGSDGKTDFEVLCVHSSGSDYQTVIVYVDVPPGISTSSRTLTLNLESGDVDTEIMLDVSGCSALRDVDGDGLVGISDLSALISDYGAVGGGSPADLDEDGDVDADDLAILLQSF